MHLLCNNSPNLVRLVVPVHLPEPLVIVISVQVIVIPVPEVCIRKRKKNLQDSNSE
jgi:hypothetical protein